MTASEQDRAARAALGLEPDETPSPEERDYLANPELAAALTSAEAPRPIRAVGHDPFIGEEFEDEDERQTLRRIRVLSKVALPPDAAESTTDRGTPRQDLYVAVVTRHADKPKMEGRTIPRISAKTLTERWRKVSH